MGVCLALLWVSGERLCKGKGVVLEKALNLGE